VPDVAKPGRMNWLERRITPATFSPSACGRGQGEGAVPDVATPGRMNWLQRQLTLPAFSPSPWRRGQGEGAVRDVATPNHVERRVALAGLGAALIARSAQSAERAGEVQSARGECYALTAAARRSLAVAATVFIGDSVGTGPQSALALRLGQATNVRLGSEARLRIDRFVINAGGTLVLERGAILCEHDAKASGNEMNILSPFGLIAVRGTRVWGGPSNGVFGVFVEYGAVTVTGRRKTVLVVSGFGTNIAYPGDEPTAPAPWGAARIKSALDSVM
jgi:FecR protein